MAKKISNSFIKELIASADIVDVISRYVNLKKSGKNYKACCPFHNEKTPSFYVTPDKNFFHCFGCQASGDALTFVRKINNLDFIDSVKNLAEIVGKPIEYENYSQEDFKKEQVYNSCISFLDIVQKYYRWNLGNSATKTKAIEYLKIRGVSSDLAKVFGIGYASDGWQNAVELAKSAKVTQDILIDSGVAIKNDNGRVYDRFRNRVMFPIRNIQGNVVAYGGRVLDSSSGVKYINSPETPVFQKNNVLYGLYEYRQYKKQDPDKVSKSLVVVEGYMDVVSLAQNGFYGAVATLGTAFSENHAKILFRETSSVILCFDGDSAGQNAALRTIKIILPILDGNKKLKILTLEDNNDPDDYIKKYGLQKFYNAVENSIPVTEFLTNSFVGDRDISKAESKAEIIENLKSFLIDVSDNIYSESIITTISEYVGIKVDQVKKLLKSYKKSSDIEDNNQKGYIEQKKLAKHLLLEERILAELLVNISEFRVLVTSYAFEIFSASKILDILSKSLKILKEDSSNEIEAVILIQLLAEDYPDYREYFFELLSYGIRNTEKESVSYNDQILKDLNRIEKKSVELRLKYLATLPFRTEVQEMERKYLVAKLVN